jgi:hypothetical protein
MAMDGIAGVHARINDILSQFQGAPVRPDATSAPTTDFASALAQAQAPGATTPAASAPAAMSPSVGPTSDGELNRAGVDPVQWAKDFLTRLNAPITSENMRAITAWEQAEGTAARFNPLATTQGGFSGETNFNSVGVKNYASYADGLDANVKVINNGLYSNILAALQRGDDAHAVAQAITNSPWGTGALVDKILSAQN